MADIVSPGLVWDLEAKFRARFGGSAQLYRAPGRVNLIGEHTDYNDGYVMPAAIDFSCWAAIAPRKDRKLVIYSENVGETAEADLDERLRPRGNWSDYPIGVAVTLERAGYSLPGANVYIHSEVPLGAGLSSSAALEVSVANALLASAGTEIDRVRLALLCRRAENEFVGARCGIMDQFVACNARAGHALLLDCRSLAYRLLRMPESVRLVVCNTMVKHEHATGEYNRRRSECEEATRRLAEALPNVRALRDVTPLELDEHRDRLTATLRKRARHVISENRRVQEAANALEKGDLDNFGRLMLQSHRSLRDDYEVSSPELEIMVELAARQKSVFGVRLTGGGFGGCTINLVSAADAADFRSRIVEGYQAATGREPDIYVCSASQGAEAVAVPAAGNQLTEQT